MWGASAAGRPMASRCDHPHPSNFQDPFPISISFNFLVRPPAPPPPFGRLGEGGELFSGRARPVSIWHPALLCRPRAEKMCCLSLALGATYLTLCRHWTGLIRTLMLILILTSRVWAHFVSTLGAAVSSGITSSFYVPSVSRHGPRAPRAPRPPGPPDPQRASALEPRQPSNPAWE